MAEVSTIPATLKPWAKYIQSVDRDPDGWSVSLKDGWWIPENETHQAYENTLQEIASKLKDGIEKCDCADCLKNLRVR
jgi:hypothetical protein